MNVSPSQTEALAKSMVASMGRDKAFLIAWTNMEYIENDKRDTAFWASVAESIDPVWYDEWCEEKYKRRYHLISGDAYG